ncbi:MAG: ABC transporter ATP-binding protein [Polyangiales bacterium]
MLSIRGITKTYDNGVHALDDVTLDIAPGMFGLLGPNGAGKSSLMRTLATLQDPDRGSIRFDGLDLIANKDAARRLLGYLPQDFGVYPRVSAEDLLDHFAQLKGFVRTGERREVVRAMLAQVNLYDVRKQKLGTFSGGMRQRFGIAQALIARPRLLIVDEPTAGLDPEERNRFLDLLAAVGEQVVVLLSTHIVEDVTDLCPSMAILARGKVRMTGSPRDAVDALRGRVWSKVVPKGELDAHKATFEVLSTRLVAGRTQVHVHALEAPGAGFGAVEPGLEDVYFRVLRGDAGDGSA